MELIDDIFTHSGQGSTLKVVLVDYHIYLDKFHTSPSPKRTQITLALMCSFTMGTVKADHLHKANKTKQNKTKQNKTKQKKITE
jgi:hypothetical protein